MSWISVCDCRFLFCHCILLWRVCTCLLHPPPPGTYTHDRILPSLLLMELWILLNFLAARLHYWLMVDFMYTRSPRAFLQSCFPAPAPMPPVLVCVGVIPPQEQDLTFPFVGWTPRGARWLTSPGCRGPSDGSATTRHISHSFQLCASCKPSSRSGSQSLIQHGFEHF